MNKSTPIVITGANGFIGSAVISALKEAGYSNVIPLSRSEGSLKDEKFLTERIPEKSVVLHFAWSSTPATAEQDPDHDSKENIGNLESLLKVGEAKKIKSFIFSSSGGTVYGNDDRKSSKETDTTDPKNAYGTLKLLAEQKILEFSKRTHIPTLIARIANVYGRNINSNETLWAVDNFIKRALNNDPLIIRGDGSVVRDYVYIDDVAAFFVAALKSPLSGIYNVGTGKGTSLSELTQLIETTLSKPITITYEPSRKIDLPYNVLDISKAVAAGWRPQYDLKSGITKIISRKNMKTAQRILVTGGLGFIGSHFVELALEKGYFVINVDKKTYAIREDLEFDKHPNYRLIEKDIAKLKRLPENITHIVNFAAESHVANSIENNKPFYDSNIGGVYNLLELVRKTPEEKRPVFIQISTDEVYGDILEGSYSEDDRLKPSNPYSATKAAADQLVLGWSRTHGLRSRICRSSNNYGFGQRAEKLIPMTMKLAIKGTKIPVHGDGSYKREWTYVKDNCEGVLAVMEKGKDGEIYNISAQEEHTNLEVIKKVLKVMGRPENFYEFVPNRPGQDLRYSVTTDKIQSLGWKPTMTLDQYLPICKKQNEIRTQKMPLGKKRRLLRLLHLESIFYKDTKTNGTK